MRFLRFAIPTALACIAFTVPPALAQQVNSSSPSETSLSSKLDAQALRTTLAQRIPQLAAIEEIRPTPMEGLYEVRVGTDLFYANANGDFLIQGELYDTKVHRNLTEDRIKALTAVDFSKLPIQDAFTLVRGDGSRKIAIFEDPNCGYCKRFERDMAKLDNITVYVFLYPILSPDSFEKSRDIWCAKDRVAAWNGWMIDDRTPESQPSCDKLDAIQRNLAFGKQYKITGTPTVIFEDGARIPGAIPSAQVERKLQEIAKLSKTSSK
ncbi:DsbC family protein [Allofranklinella schreckenbergeri]|uniref:Thiol:disulfide interchange protein n=1 Tax=Allofranklinella schreckenbergeri TaxID=1076744 RepID=A0A3M6QSR0_9BURK|nr:DsbC family protein [Allofranklinella schreckenbergeri]RMX06074.1 DsbC family protein [Allofranklinella schreckenbergeri]